MITGKSLRLRRIIDEKTKSSVIFAMDHGAFMGPIKGIEHVDKIINEIATDSTNAIILNRGILTFCCDKIKQLGIILQLSCTTTLCPNPNIMAQVCSVEQAIKLGVDAVTVSVNLGNESDPNMLRLFGKIADQCEEYGIPLVAMAELTSFSRKAQSNQDILYLKHACRLVAELGADIVKTTYTGDVRSFREIVDACPAPVVIGGGPKTDTNKDLLTMVKGSKEAGAIGVALGRNVFQHKNPKAIMRAIAAIIRMNITVEEALKEININSPS